MADTQQENTAPTQKRPLEEPSSPSGPTDQPEAKRPALDKVIKEDDTAKSEQPPAEDAAPIETTTGAESASTVDQAPESLPAPVEKPTLDQTDKHGDTVVPDAPTNGNGNAAPVMQAANGHASGSGGRASQPYHNQDETSWLHLRAIISSTEAATVIGKGGENVTQIRRIAGAKCTVSEYSRGAVERILTVSGVAEAVAKAFGLIIRTLNQEPIEQTSTPQSKTYPLRLLVPHILIGSIIGKGGVRIREIQDASGARLNVSESCLPLSTERSLVVLGVADAVHIATYYVSNTLVEQLTERFGGPAASNYASRHGGSHGVVPGSMQVVPYVPAHAGGVIGHPDQYRKHPGGPDRTPTIPYGVPYMHGTPPQPQVHAPIHYGPGSPRAPYPAGPPAQPAPYGQPAGQPPMGGPPQPGMPGQSITQQIFIPNDMVGAIIGKGGQKINEIRQLSGSVIKINEPTDNTNERLVTITGTAECNQMALYMLYSRLGESSKNSNAMMPR